MAPEILFQNKYHKKSDVYSFGGIIFEILTNGKYPWMFNSIGDSDDYIEEFKYTVEKNNYIPNLPVDEIKIESKQISDFLINLSRNCWEFDYKDRPSFIEIENDINNFIKSYDKKKKNKKN